MKTLARNGLALTSGTAAVWLTQGALSIVQCSLRACEPAPAAASVFELPITIIYCVLSFCCVLPCILLLARHLHFLAASAVISGVVSTATAWAFFLEGVDSSEGAAFLAAYLFIPWFVGGVVAHLMWPNHAFNPTPTPPLRCGAGSG